MRAAEDKPILVSIGYAACHWCHVMERESFENPQIAALMNERFVCIKVDREERPDVDAIYMDAVQAMTGHGGWPLNAFLTPRRRAVLRRHLLPARAAPAACRRWPQVRDRRRERVARAARGDRGARASRSCRGSPARPALAARRGRHGPGARSTRAVDVLRRGYDQEHGGFSTAAPKFPPASTIEFLLRARRARRWRCTRCARWPRGGMYDQVGGGFARYSVDARWVIPHFEKMLYDNALLARAYLHGCQVSGEPFFARVCTETLDWALRDLRQEEGGFASALDADSEGVEGRFYVWTPDEMRAALGDDARAGGARVLRARPGRRTSRAPGRPVRADAATRTALRARSRRGCAPRASSGCGRRSTTSA